MWEANVDLREANQRVTSVTLPERPNGIYGKYGDGLQVAFVFLLIFEAAEPSVI